MGSENQLFNDGLPEKTSFPEVKNAQSADDHAGQAVFLGERVSVVVSEERVSAARLVEQPGQVASGKSMRTTKPIDTIRGVRYG
jgi:hypothetical protein